MMKGGDEIRFRTAAAALALGSLVWGFWDMLTVHAPNMFRNPQEDMSFAWYVPLLSAYVLWTERKKLVEAVSSPSWAGLLMSLPLLAVGFLGSRGLQLRLSIVAFAGLLITVPWAVYGRAMAARMLFPAAFLLFCMPMATFLDVVTVHLRLLASSVAFAVLKGFGADVIRSGTSIAAADGTFAIDVADPCGGLRSLFALMALTGGYAYFNQRTWLRRGSLFAASVPIAIIGNVFRILSICLVAAYASNDFATGFYHDYSGYVVFIVAIALMVGTGELISRVRPGAKTCDVKAEKRADAGRGGFQAVVPVLTVLLVVPVMWRQSEMPAVTVADPPAVSLPDIPGCRSTGMEVSEAELYVLPKDTKFEKRMYTDSAGDWFAVSAVIGGSSKQSIHRPELCLPAQGYLMESPRDGTTAGGTDWRLITLKKGGSGALGFAYTFVNQEGYRTSSHVLRILRDVWDRTVYNRIDRWVMITVNSSCSDDGKLLDFLSRLEGVVK